MKKKMANLTQLKPATQLADFAIMGVINLTPNSFSGDGLIYQYSALKTRINQHIANGADILDFGAESSRPGAQPVLASTQLERLAPAFEIMQEIQHPFSIDTTEPIVMSAAISAGATYINTIDALQTPGALATVAQSSVKVILMHMQNTPKNMQAQPKYANVVYDIVDFLQQRIAVCKKNEISHERLIIDPGFGFGKSKQHNYLILNNLNIFSNLGLPLLVGMSRKSMLNSTGLGKTLPHERDVISCGADIIALLHGANIIRTHNPSLLNQMRAIWRTAKEYEI